MNEIVPAPSNNDKTVTAKGKPGKYLRAKIMPVVCTAITSVCQYKHNNNESCLHTDLKIPSGGMQRGKWAESLQGRRNPSCWVLWTNRFFCNCHWIYNLDMRLFPFFPSALQLFESRTNRFLRMKILLLWCPSKHRTRNLKFKYSSATWTMDFSLQTRPPFPQSWLCFTSKWWETHSSTRLAWVGF